VPHPAYGCVAVHPVALHKDQLGWIPPERKLALAPGPAATAVLERLADPPADGPLMVEVAVGGTPEYLTVEARRPAGYDAQIPGPAVLVHRVDPDRADRRAQVVDPDGDGDPNDASAMWLPGESLGDAATGTRVGVTGASATGYQVVVTIDAFRLTATAVGDGALVADPPGLGCPGACTAPPLYRAGTEVTLTAIAPPEAPLVTWAGCDAASDLTCRVLMDADRAVTASFAATWPLAVSRGGPGAVTSEPAGIDCGTACTAGFAPGEWVTLAAVPRAAGRFERWRGCDEALGTTCRVRMTGPRTVRAVFARLYRLSIATAGAGRVTSAPGGIDCGAACASAYPAGTAVALAAEAAAQHAFAGWGGDADCLDGTVTLAADTACTAVFQPAAQLAMTALGDPPARARPASALAVSDTVANHGASPSGPVVVRYYLSAAGAPGAGDRPLVGARRVPALAPGAASTGAASAWVPLLTPAGTYRLLACAEDTQAGAARACRTAGGTVTIGWTAP
jgi:hypothetical protein